MLRLTRAFLAREWRNTSPAVFFGGLVQAVLSVFFWFFVTRFFSQGVPVREGVLPEGYFTFGLVGIALGQYVWKGLSSFSSRLKNLQASGGFESLWLAPHPFLLLALLFSVWDFVCASLYAAAILAVGRAGFGADISLLQALQIMGIGAVVGISAVCYALLVASCNLAWGYAENARNLLSRGMVLVSGTFFPVGLLPAFIRSLAFLLPLTHALILARWVTGSNPPAGWELGAMLFLLTAGLLFTAGVAWNLAVRTARVKGRLTST